MGCDGLCEGNKEDKKVIDAAKNSTEEKTAES